MSDMSPALPEWISPPGSIVARMLDRRQVELDDFAQEMGLSSRATRGLIEGTVVIDPPLAACLAAVIGSTAAFWLRSERTYREDVERNIASYVDDNVRAWMGRLPLKELADLGWIKRYRDPVSQAQECFRFFGIVGLEGLRDRQDELLAGVNFRTSAAFQSQPPATSAWLRWAEGQAEDAPCQRWDRGAFESLLSDIKALSRNHHPERFVPRLKEICASAGVAVVIAPAPKGCSASGATRLIRGRKAMIALSFRYYSDDQFWFTFFHEAGHLIRHFEQQLFLEKDDSADEDQSLFLEEGQGNIDRLEDEADQFALDALIPRVYQERMLNLPPEHDAYIAFAREVGIAPGIVVGQMQRLGRLPYAWLNKLKRRFKWKSLYDNGVIP